jgi:DNA polymerase-3 subunit gamma/tau
MTLYRKYRPTRFSDLLGQPSTSRTLQQALGQERVAHAYLFSGPRGTGKTTTARIFARALTCEKPIIENGKDGFSYEPCNTCATCLSILHNQCPDIMEIDAASNRGIEDIRSLREQIQYGPLQLSRKVYIIDEVHMLTGEAFNALLKTLEEPPAHALFILATTELHKVPATIRSRCQLMRFERAGLASLTEKLSAITAAEKWDIEKGALELIAEHADGAFRDAETLLEHLATQHQPLTTALTIDTLGIVEDSLLNSLLEAVSTQNTSAILTLLNTHFADSGLRMERVLSQLIEKVRTALYASEGKNSGILTRFLTALLEAYILLKSSPSPLLVLEIACLSVCENTSQESISIPFQKPEKTVEYQAPKHTSTPPIKVVPVPTSVRDSVPVVEIHDAAIKDIRRAWKQAVDEISRTNLPLGQMLREALFHSATETDITVHVRYKFHTEKLGEKKNRQRIEELLEKLTGKSWKIIYILSESVPRRQPSKDLQAGSTLNDATAVFGGTS